VRSQLAAQGASIYERFDQVYTDAIFAEPMLTTAKTPPGLGTSFLLLSLRQGVTWRCGIEFPGSTYRRTSLPFWHSDSRISAWMQAQWVAFARDDAPADGAAWRPYGGDERILVIGDNFHQGRIEDEPVVPLLHRLRTIKPSSPTGFSSLWRRLW
jgi:para-nitrobenzyl esterase